MTCLGSSLLWGKRSDCLWWGRLHAARLNQAAARNLRGKRGELRVSASLAGLRLYMLKQHLGPKEQILAGAR